MTPDSGPVQVQYLALPTEIGLRFDAATGEISGTPLTSGDFALPLRGTGPMGEFDGECLLIVIPNPKDLWQNLPTDPTAPYFKSNEHGHLIEAPDFRILGASKRGRSHAHAGAFRDDDFFIAHAPSTGWSVLVVADGAGSARFSRKGSELAAHVAGDCLLRGLVGSADWAGGEDPSDAQKNGFCRLFASAAAEALAAIEEEAAAQGAAFADFATTLLAAAVRKDECGYFVAAFGVGDGAIAAYSATGRVQLLGKPDGGEFAGETRFLDRAVLADAPALASRLGVGYFDSLQALMLMTDGISDPLFETDNGLTDGSRWAAFWAELQPLLEEPDPAASVLDWMDFFKTGHHDDRTIALLWPRGE